MHLNDIAATSELDISMDLSNLFGEVHWKVFCSMFQSNVSLSHFQNVDRMNKITSNDSIDA